jgi:hypothetical protein
MPRLWKTSEKMKWECEVKTGLTAYIIKQRRIINTPKFIRHNSNHYINMKLMAALFMAELCTIC